MIPQSAASTTRSSNQRSKKGEEQLTSQSLPIRLLRALPIWATLGFLVLSAGWKLTIAVRPVSSLGTKGKAIATTWRV